jgi:hypothetical protein
MPEAGAWIEQKIQAKGLRSVRAKQIHWTSETTDPGGQPTGNVEGPLSKDKAWGLCFDSKGLIEIHPHQPVDVYRGVTVVS